MSNGNFSGTVAYYTNRNGKVERWVRRFTDAQEYNKFCEEHSLWIPSFGRFGFPDLSNGFSSFFENIFNGKALWDGETTSDVVSKYDKARAEFEEQERAKEEEKARATRDIEALKNHRQYFEEKWMKDKVAEIDKDLEELYKIVKPL